MKKSNSLLSQLILVHFLIIACLLYAKSPGVTIKKSLGLQSFDVNYTISKVRTAETANGSFIVASSYEGILLGIGYDGTILWENTLSGFMNHDVWCEDITGDGVDEILAANADGAVYCLDNKGSLMWKFKQNDAPMYSVCVVRKNGVPYVVCGGYDNNIYYLNSNGTLKQTLTSSSYSVNSVFPGINAPDITHIANFIRKIKKNDGTELMVVLGANNSMQSPGYVYVFDVLGGLVTPAVKIGTGKPVGDMRICNINGIDEILLGTSTHVNDASVVKIDPFNLKEKQPKIDISSIRKEVGAPGYRVSQPEIIQNGSGFQYFILHGPNILLVPENMNIDETEILKCSYSFNDIWKDQVTGKIILASNQSGGSDIHIIDTTNPNWKSEFVKLKSPGKTQSLLDNTAVVNKEMSNFKKPDWERNPIPVYLLHENSTDISTSKYNSPVFIPQVFMPRVQDGATWQRDTMSNEVYRKKRDKRHKYILSEQEVLNMILPKMDKNGIAYWGGHGNDPYFYSKECSEKVVDAAAGRHTVLIYPELQDNTSNFDFVLKDLIYPLATYGKDKNLKLFIRSKNIFWQGSVYLPMWSRLLSGEFARVFVPSMEETSDKTMELSIAGRMGIWASGAVDSWGSRAVPDNASYDRLRQNSDQPLDNHFLRQLIYAAANGAQYFDNFTKPNLFAQLLAKGVLYVPKRSEIVSISPVHLSMINPDEHYLEDGSEVKWLTKFNQKYEDENHFVFSRMNGSWPGAPINEWDFSRYAAGAKERRLNFLPSYKNGMVLITPPQKGVFADKKAVRGALTYYLNPIYKNIMKEYYTDGKYYYSADGKQKFDAKLYYKTIENDIEEGANKLPLTVTGDVAWVVAQTSTTHLRLTIIDGGYINPSDKNATVIFHTVQPIKMTDLLDGKSFDISNSTNVKVDISCGMFRFIDIEMKSPL
ncbi:MAG: hypothetical protein ABFC90_12440 [Bacteroidales bacterium]